MLNRIVKDASLWWIDRETQRSFRKDSFVSGFRCDEVPKDIRTTGGGIFAVPVGDQFVFVLGIERTYDSYANDHTLIHKCLIDGQIWWILEKHIGKCVHICDADVS